MSNEAAIQDALQEAVGTLIFQCQKKIAKVAHKEMRFTVQTVLDDVFVDKKKKPKIESATQKVNGWDFYISMPPSVSYTKFKQLTYDAIKTACGGNNITAIMEPRGKTAFLQIIEVPLKVYDYVWDYLDLEDGKYRKLILPIPIGMGHDLKLIVVDLAKIPHMLIGGATGNGKSTYLHGLITSLLRLPFAPIMLGVDLKLNEFAFYDNYMQIGYTQSQARDILDYLYEEMMKRNALLAETKRRDIEGLNKHHLAPDKQLEHIVCVIDELAELRDKAAIGRLDSIAKLGRSSGIHLVLSTQRPDSTIFKGDSFSAAKAQLLGRLCFGTSDAVNSRIILDRSGAEDIPKSDKGRALWHFDTADPIEVQCAFIDPEEEYHETHRLQNEITPRKVILP